LKLVVDEHPQSQVEAFRKDWNR